MKVPPKLEHFHSVRAGAVPGGQGSWQIRLLCRPARISPPRRFLTFEGIGATKSVTGMLAVALFMNSVQIGNAASAPDKLSLL